jgi:hypothetical protein
MPARSTLRTKEQKKRINESIKQRPTPQIQNIPKIAAIITDPPRKLKEKYKAMKAKTTSKDKNNTKLRPKAKLVKKAKNSQKHGQYYYYNNKAEPIKIAEQNSQQSSQEQEQSKTNRNKNKAARRPRWVKHRNRSIPNQTSK